MLAKVNVSQVSSPAMQSESYLVRPLAARDMYSSSISYNQRTQSANVRRPELLQVHTIVYLDTRINSADKVPAAPVQAAYPPF